MKAMHSMMCMLCEKRVTCPWEKKIEPVAEAAGWVTLPKGPRRRSPYSVCADCASELAVLVAGKSEYGFVVEDDLGGDTGVLAELEEAEADLAEWGGNLYGLVLLRRAEEGDTDDDGDEAGEGAQAPLFAEEPKS